MFNEYIKGDSLIHRFDPRVKIVYAFIFSFVIALQNNLGSVIFGLIVGIFLVILARIKFREVIKRILVMDEFILLLWIVIPITYPGDALLNIAGIRISHQGLIFALILTFKANAIMFVLISLVATSSIFDIVHGLIHLKIPEKLVFLFFLMYRYTWVLFDEYERLIRAIKARGFKFRNSVHTYRTVAYLVGSLLVKSYNRAEILYQAMVCRGFTGKFWVLDHFKISAIDVIGIILLTLCNIAITFTKWKLTI
ncbi:MAG: cobalt ECF transporter T component CbiQ [bacterium]